VTVVTVAANFCCSCGSEDWATEELHRKINTSRLGKKFWFVQEQDFFRSLAVTSAAKFRLSLPEMWSIWESITF